MLPAALLALLTLCIQPGGRQLAVRWAMGLAVAIAVTAASKVLFMGWGLGSAALNFTGVSGHTLLATAVFPVVLPLFGSPAASHRRNMLFAVGCLLALLIGVSRLVLHAHSPSEVLAGWALGGGVAVWVHRHPAPAVFPHRPVIAGVLVACIALALYSVDHSPSHALITRVALQLSGQPEPHSRAAMLARSATAHAQRLLQP
ncbi:phosphatase PAP2 family protein [Rhodoferax sp. GW822-FHT02A01]|uniref:phosphatase PAP2 family protein n=1 Tax=Rhodoferax sp. GW822-FHT02A01 TaxID=3141537 RepID=UPI00315D1AD4